MKILVLVQTVDAGNYPEIAKLQKSTWDSIEHPNVSTLFYTPNEERSGIVGKDLYVKESPAWEMMYVHFMKACIQALKLDWDYIFKTDNSTYVCKDILASILENKPRTKYYGGHPFYKTHPERNTPEGNPVGLNDFMWGDGFVLSRDLVVKLVEKYALNPYYLRSPEDYCVAFVLRNTCEPDTSLLISSYYDEGFSILPKKHVYRCIPSLTNVELSYDQCVKAMNDIHNQVANESISVSNVLRS